MSESKDTDIGVTTVEKQAAKPVEVEMTSVVVNKSDESVWDWIENDA